MAFSNPELIQKWSSWYFLYVTLPWMVPSYVNIALSEKHITLKEFFASLQLEVPWNIGI